MESQNGLGFIKQNSLTIFLWDIFKIRPAESGHKSRNTTLLAFVSTIHLVS